MNNLQGNMIFTLVEYKKALKTVYLPVIFLAKKIFE